MIQQIKEKFKYTTKNSEKIQLLTILPKSWTVRKMEKEFNVSNFMARKAKKLVEEHGILSTPNIKPRKTVLSDVVKSVKDFYESDEVSRCMPGLKDYVSV